MFQTSNNKNKKKLGDCTRRRGGLHLWAGLVSKKAANRRGFWDGDESCHVELAAAESCCCPAEAPSVPAGASPTTAGSGAAGSMLVTALSCFLSALLAAAAAGKLPEAEVKVEVLHRPFLCRRKTKYGDMLLVHQEGYFQNGTMFHSRWVPPGALPVLRQGCGELCLST